MMDVKAERIDIRLEIQSYYIYLDGHKEEGPSTHIKATVTDRSSFDAVQKVIESAIDSCRDRAIGSKILSFLGNFSADIAGIHSEHKKEMEYHINLNATKYNEDGTIETLNEEGIETRPIYRLI